MEGEMIAKLGVTIHPCDGYKLFHWSHDEVVGSKVMFHYMYLKIKLSACLYIMPMFFLSCLHHVSAPWLE